MLFHTEAVFIQARVEAMELEDPLTRAVQIKMSGCPNGCGQHHIGTIGFYGEAERLSDEENFEAYAERVGNERFEAEVKELTLPLRSHPREGECAI